MAGAGRHSDIKENLFDAEGADVRPTHIVGIGASAGGLEAFTELLRNLPTDAGVAYVLVQHLDPTHRSLLSELLARTTTIPVREIVHNSSVRANQIYVIPPNCDLRLSGGILKLSRRQKGEGPSRSIDRFLKSLADDQKENAIAVILSGAGSDGSQGLKAVKAQGGITFAQDENSAKYNSMPRSATATGSVDFVLPPEKIAEEIARFIRQPHTMKRRASANARNRKGLHNGISRVWRKSQNNGLDWPTGPTDVNLRKIFLTIKTKMGVDFALYKINTVRRRITRRMALNKVKSLEDYARLLREQPAEVEALYQDLLINVTSFFRNPGAFEVLKKKIFPKIVANHSGPDALRIWVTGCSTGQEAYSIAMAYAEFAEHSLAQIPVQIFATDLNGAVLERARLGRYTKAQMEGVSEKRVKRFFTAEDGYFRVQKAVRDLVVFAQHNLLIDPPFTRVDLITCRNLLIYLEPSLQQRIIPRFHYALKPDSFLWLGASESIAQFANLFGTVEKSHKIFCRKPASSWLPLERPPALPPRTIKGAPNGPMVRPEEFSVLDAQKEADRVLLAKYTPVSVLVSEDLEILQFRGETSQYLALPSGKASFQLLKMAKDGLSLPLQRLMLKARKTQKIMHEKDLRLMGRGGPVNITVVPLKNLRVRCYLILFEKPPRPAKLVNANRETAKSSNGRAKAGLRQAVESKQELAELREQIQSVQEEHETAVEELQASNEEVQSSNEELQSLNEELETSNEELESANEELTTLNEELTTRNTELRESEGRLREQAQLLDMAPILARSSKDRIAIWSGGAEKLYGFTQEEAVGQTSYLLLNARYFEPVEKIQGKLDRDGHWEGEAVHRRKNGQSLYVALQWVVHHDAQKKIRAILEVHTDITARKEAEKALLASEEFNRSILDSSSDSIKVLDTKFRLVFMNIGGQKLMEDCDFKGGFNSYWPGLWQGESRAAAEAAAHEALLGKVARFQGVCPTAKGVSKWWDVVVTPILGPDGAPEKLLAVSRDITEKKQAEDRHAEQVRLAAARAEIVVALGRIGNSSSILQNVAEILVKYLDGAFVRIWILNETEEILELQASAGMYTHINGDHSRIKVGNLKIGRIAQQRRPHLNNDLQNDEEVGNPEWVKREGMAAFAGYPLIVEDCVVGVVAMFAKKPLPETARSELSFAADSIAQFVQRRRAEASREIAQKELNSHLQDLEHRIAERTASLQETIGELEAFSYSVSHDLRTPLRAMEGYARALLEDCREKVGPEHCDYLERIVRGASRLDRLTLDVLAYSRLSRTDFELQPIDLNHLVEDIIDQYPQLESVRSMIDVQAPLLPVLGHSAFLTQCIFNLLGNAIKFVAPSTKPSVKIWTDGFGPSVRLSVSDNGIGIAPEHRDRIFQIFGRVHHDKAYEGTGIGLAVVKRAVERMGGTVDFYSEPGKGSRFWIELPKAELVNA